MRLSRHAQGMTQTLQKLSLIPAAFCIIIITIGSALILVATLNHYETENAKYIAAIAKKQLKTLKPFNLTESALIGEHILEIAHVTGLKVVNNRGDIILQQGTAFDIEAPAKLLQRPIQTIVGDEYLYISRKFNDRTDSSETDKWLILAIDRSTNFIARYQSFLILFSALVSGFLMLALTSWRQAARLRSTFIEFEDTLYKFSRLELTDRVAPQQIRELEQLRTCINTTGEKLLKERDDLRRIMDANTQEIHESMETIEVQSIELDIAHKEAVKANLSKSEFLANTSHEIRTPINGIIGFTQLLSKTSMTEQQREYLQTINSSSQGLLTNINDILDFSRLEAGTLQLDYQALQLDQIITESCQALNPLAEAKGLALEISMDSNTPLHLLGDPLRLKQILNCLISNAIKFSNNGSGNIHIKIGSLTTHRGKTQLHIRIHDPGIGIPKEQQPQIFEAFKQADTSHSRKFGGIGLGLSLAQALAKKMNGEIGIESTEQNGTLVWFTATLGVLNDIHTKVEKTAAGNQATPEILAVDDNPANLKLLSEFLTNLGVNVTTASSGSKALAKVQQQTFDLIYMDVQMPEMDGLATSKLVRESEQPGHRTPIIALTANAMNEQKTELLLAGLDDYMSKPVSELQLRHSLNRWLKKTCNPHNALAVDQTDEKKSAENTEKPDSYSPVIMNIGSALDRTNGKAKLAKDMLEMLLKSLPETVKTIKKSSEQNDWPLLWDCVHKLHGGCCYCGVPQLLEASAALDQLLKDHFTEELKAPIAEVLKAIESLLNWAEEHDLDSIFELTEA